MGMTSQGYTMHISGPEGRETYMVTYKGRLVGGGDLRKMLAKSKGRERLQKFEQKNSAHTQAQARLRLFQLDSKLSENP
jgi:hypothetical protein